MPAIFSPRLSRPGFLALYMSCLLFCLLLTHTLAQSAPQPVFIAVGGDNLTRLLWNNPDGSISVWRINSDGSEAAQYPYGPYPGWNATTFAVGADSAPRVLYNHTADGQMSLWRMDPTANAFTQNTYGPYSGWAAAAIAVGGNNAPRILWNHPADGLMSLWNVNPTTSAFTSANYGPYSGYKAFLVAAGPNSLPRVLWNYTGGVISLWYDVPGASDYAYQNYGPFSGYTAIALAVDSGNAPHVLWTGPSSTVSLWNVATNGTYAYQNYADPAGYVPVGMACGTGGDVRILWSDSLGDAQVWTIASGGAYTSKIYPSLLSVGVSPSSVSGGSSATGTVTLTNPAPAGGVSVALSSSSASASVPASVTVAAGSSSGTFTVSTTAVSAAATATLTASFSGISKTTTLTVNPTPASVSDLSAYSTGSGKVTLYWTALSGATGYNVYRGTAAGGENYMQPVNGASSVNAASYSGSPMDMYSDTGLVNGTQYFYTVKAVYGSAQSAASNEDSDVPDPAAVPWDTRNPAAIISAFSSAFSSDTSSIGADPFSLRVVGPDNTIYDPSFSTAQPPDGSVAVGTNQLTRPDGSTQALPDDEGELDSATPSTSSAQPNAVGTALQGDKGPFRRVSTHRNANGNGDYRGATGIFVLPTATVSQTALTSHGDSPVIYLGVSGSSVEVDAGLAYQNGTHSWALEMQVAGKIVAAQGGSIPPVPLENAPAQYQRFAPGSSVVMSYWAWGTYPTTGRAKLSLLLVDSLDDSTAAALGAPSKYLNRQENVRVKRVHAVAQTNLQNVPSVFPTGTTVNAASWSQGSVFLPDSSGSSQGWSSSDGTTLGEDGYYDGGKSDVNANRTSPYIQEDGITIVIHSN